MKLFITICISIFMVFTVLLSGVINAGANADYKIISEETREISNEIDFRVDDGRIVYGNAGYYDSGYYYFDKVYDYNIETATQSAIPNLKGQINIIGQAANGNFIIEGYCKSSRTVGSLCRLHEEGIEEWSTGLYLYKNGVLTTLAEDLDADDNDETPVEKSYGADWRLKTYDGTLLWTQMTTIFTRKDCYYSNYEYTYTYKRFHLDRNGTVTEVMNSECGDACDSFDLWSWGDCNPLDSLSDFASSEENQFAWGKTAVTGETYEDYLYIGTTGNEISEYNTTESMPWSDGEYHHLRFYNGDLYHNENYDQYYKFDSNTITWNYVEDEQLSHDISWTYGEGEINSYNHGYGKKRGNYEIWIEYSSLYGNSKVHRKNLLTGTTDSYEADFEYNGYEWQYDYNNSAGLSADFTEDGNHIVYTVFRTDDEDKKHFALALLTLDDGETESLTLKAGPENPNNRLESTEEDINHLTVVNQISLRNGAGDSDINLDKLIYDFVRGEYNHYSYKFGITPMLAFDSDCNGAADDTNWKTGFFWYDQIFFEKIGKTISPGVEYCYILLFSIPSSNYYNRCYPIGAKIAPNQNKITAYIGDNNVTVTGDTVQGAVVLQLEDKCGFVVNSNGDIGDGDLSDYRCSTTDDGIFAECTLRAAVEQAYFEKQKITFNIPLDKSKPFNRIITLSKPLVIENYSVEIDGTLESSTRHNEFGKIKLGSQNGHGQSGIIIKSGSTIRDLDVRGFRSAIQLNSSGSHITDNVLANNNIGIEVLEDKEGNTIEENQIYNSKSYGIKLDGDDTTVIGNYIGYSKGFAGNKTGIFINSGNNIIGGASGNERNVISGNNDSGIEIAESAYFNTIKGNYIGIDSEGSKKLGNFTGIRIYGSYNTIGGYLNSEGNVIGGNDFGVELNGGEENSLLGNYIGVDSVDTPFGNTYSGITIMDGSQNNKIGDTNEGGGNAIAYNSRGIGIKDDSTKNNEIRSNTMYSNTNIGIDLNIDGDTENDSGDTDNGPNNLQNYPDVIGAVLDDVGLTITGEMDSKAGEVILIEFFSTQWCQEFERGQGVFPLGRAEVTRTGEYPEEFLVIFPNSKVKENEFITATATDSQGNTSEFSPCISVYKEE